MTDINKYRDTPVSFTDGQESREDRVDAVGNKVVTLGTKVSSPSDAPVMAYPPVSIGTRISTATTTIPSATGTSGWFRLKVQNGTMGAVTVYDNGAASGTVLFTGTPAAKDVIFGEWTYFGTGLTIVTAAATQLYVEVIPQS